MSFEFNPLDYPIIFASPLRSPGDSAWREHLPFAKFLVDILKPRTIVELGTYAGASYCAFCQAVKELGLNTSCYAVDTWLGDAQAGEFGIRSVSILEDLRRHHDPLYSGFSRLLQSTFDEALSYLEDRSVDLMHIDGFHSYEAVKHDYDTWLPKVSSRGVVLFHDIAVTKPGFGVKKFWEETKLEYPHFEFDHGYGLGILAVGEEQPQAFLEFLRAPSSEADRMRLFFSEYGAGMSALGDKHIAEKSLQEVKRQLTEVQASMTWRATQKLKRLRRLIVSQKRVPAKSAP